MLGVQGLSKHAIDRAFGSFSVAMQAAGIPMARDSKRRKIGNEIFEKPLEPILEEARGRQLEHKPSNFILPKNPYPRTVLLGDFHAPFHHVGAVKFAIDFIREFKPERVIQMGDLYDMYASSKFPRSLNIYTPNDEFLLGRKAAEQLWRDVKEAAPNAECYQLLGNHDIRPIKRLIEEMPSMESVVNLDPLFAFPGVKTIHDSREELILDGVAYHHGYRLKLGDMRDFMNMCSADAHTHRGGVVYRRVWGGNILWQLNAGYLADAESKALGYAPQRHNHSTLGLGAIDEWGPRFVPYVA